MFGERFNEFEGFGGFGEPMTVTEFLDDCNGALKSQFSDILVEGEVASFKVNQGKWVFFDLKDGDVSVNCFLPLFRLRVELADGMRVVVRATAGLTKWGKFSLTVEQIRLVGEGSIKKSFELLKKKLAGEGLFDVEKKKPLPEPRSLKKIGVISSTGAAGYADFVKILNERWGGVKVLVAHTQVQGFDAPDQIIRALKYFNEKTDVEVIAIMRGGGSADDLSAFNDEKMVREIAASRIPVITGIGHEVDESLADLAADFRASTPSNVAQILVPDRKADMRRVDDLVGSIRRNIVVKITTMEEVLRQKIRILEAFDPSKVLKRGYAILSGKIDVGSVVKITTLKQEIKAEIKEVSDVEK